MKKITFIIVALLAFSLTSHAQLEKYKAVFIYKFVQNFEWSSTKGGSTYKIGVLGDNVLFDELTGLLASRTADGKPFEVIKYTPGMDVADIYILFISDKDNESLTLLADQAKANSTVIVTESPSLAKQGASLNFVSSGGSLKFELNERSLSECKVKTSGSIKSLAILVN